MEIIVYVLVGVVVGFILFLVNFYRDPERFPPASGNVVVAPADGKLVCIREVWDNEILWSAKGRKKVQLKEIVWDEDLKIKSGHMLGVYMSLFNVHVNRAPISGKVVKIKHCKGRRLRIGNVKFEFLNERNIIVLEHRDGFRVAVVQIAALIVGRIDCYVKEGMTVKLGQRIGKVKFGSQVDLVIPNLPGIKFMKMLGEKLLAGETIIAEYG